jgi:hypothetical protein
VWQGPIVEDLTWLAASSASESLHVLRGYAGQTQPWLYVLCAPSVLCFVLTIVCVVCIRLVRRSKWRAPDPRAVLVYQLFVLARAGAAHLSVAMLPPPETVLFVAVTVSTISCVEPC